ncbi:unnamed protein product, partial [Prorocentrum cordatum]
MPPPQAAREASELVGPTCAVYVPDASALALLPAEGLSGMRLLHCLGNSRRGHMMSHPPGPGASDAEEGEEEEVASQEDEAGGGEGEDGEEASGGGDEGVLLSPFAAAAVSALCAAAPGTPLASRPARGTPAGGLQVEALLQQVGAPRRLWPGVCAELTQVAAHGLLAVVGGGAGAAAARGANAA